MGFTPDVARQLGARGGRATVERHGRDHMRRIGWRGFRAVAAQRRIDGEGNLWSPYTWLLWKLHGIKVRDNGKGCQPR
jgi:hypothetical protein